MIYTITDSFTKLSERSGTIQNSCIYPIEVSNKAQPGTGITLRPNEKISFANLTVYVRSESLKGEIRVVPFIIGTVGSSSSGSDDPAQEGYDNDIDNLWEDTPPASSDTGEFDGDINDLWEEG